MVDLRHETVLLTHNRSDPGGVEKCRYHEGREGRNSRSRSHSWPGSGGGYGPDCIEGRESQSEGRNTDQGYGANLARTQEANSESQGRRKATPQPSQHASFTGGLDENRRHLSASGTFIRSLERAGYGSLPPGAAHASS
jgi:hypothetical protein